MQTPLFLCSCGISAHIVITSLTSVFLYHQHSRWRDMTRNTCARSRKTSSTSSFIAEINLWGIKTINAEMLGKSNSAGCPKHFLCVWETLAVHHQLQRLHLLPCLWSATIFEIDNTKVDSAPLPLKKGFTSNFHFINLLFALFFNCICNHPQLLTKFPCSASTYILSLCCYEGEQFKFWWMLCLKFFVIGLNNVQN